MRKMNRYLHWCLLLECWGRNGALEKQLGQGGMGKVYRATDVYLRRTVAVKMIRDELFSNQTAMEKFRQESRVTASLAHPNVVMST